MALILAHERQKREFWRFLKLFQVMELPEFTV
jgi:hypothetical protein